MNKDVLVHVVVTIREFREDQAFIFNWWVVGRES